MASNKALNRVWLQPLRLKMLGLRTKKARCSGESVGGRAIFWILFMSDGEDDRILPRLA